MSEVGRVDDLDVEAEFTEPVLSVVDLHFGWARSQQISDQPGWNNHQVLADVFKWYMSSVEQHRVRTNLAAVGHQSDDPTSQKPGDKQHIHSKTSYKLYRHTSTQLATFLSSSQVS